MAGKVSSEVNASLLILNHISSKSDRCDSVGRSNQLKLIREAKESSEGKSEVVVAYDFMELLVPRIGFGAIDEENESSTSHSQVAPNGQGEGKTETQGFMKDLFETKV